MCTLTVETESIQPLAHAGARAIACIWTQPLCRATLNAVTNRVGMSRRRVEPLTWQIRRESVKRLSGRLNWQLSRRLIRLFRFIRQPPLRQEWPQEHEVSLAWCRLYIMSACQKTLKGLVRCLITRPTYSLGHGLKVMRWQWSGWRTAMQQWVSISL